MHAAASLLLSILAALQWAEDDDPGLGAARAAWDQVDRIAVWALLALCLAIFVVCAFLLLRHRAASRRRRLAAVSLTAVGCGACAGVVHRMGVIWLVADPQEAGGPVLGSTDYWIWLAWLAGAALLGLASVVGAFIVVGAEDL